MITKNIKTNLELVGYLTEIDKTDYDYIYIISDKIPTNEEILKLLENEKEVSLNIDINIYEIYEDKTKNLKNIMSCAPLNDKIDGWKVIEYINIDKKNSYLKLLKNFKLRNKINEFNKIEELEEEFNKIIQEIFIYTGNKTIVNKENLEKLENLIREIGNNIK